MEIWVQLLGQIGLSSIKVLFQNHNERLENSAIY
jgi:hypothetical protein